MDPLSSRDHPTCCITWQTEYCAMCALLNVCWTAIDFNDVMAFYDFADFKSGDAIGKNLREYGWNDKRFSKKNCRFEGHKGSSIRIWIKWRFIDRTVSFSFRFRVQYSIQIVICICQTEKNLILNIVSLIADEESKVKWVPNAPCVARISIQATQSFTVGTPCGHTYLLFLQFYSDFFFSFLFDFGKWANCGSYFCSPKEKRAYHLNM